MSKYLFSFTYENRFAKQAGHGSVIMEAPSLTADNVMGFVEAAKKAVAASNVIPVSIVRLDDDEPKQEESKEE